uniref:Uncharacterized protein n=1 Tax=Magallana gigas TaxID=29159 RepID=A0A8W8MCZ1_MAGGI
MGTTLQEIFLALNCPALSYTGLQCSGKLYPEREELKTRKVFLYEKLSPGAMSFLGLSRNDETSNSLRTSQFEELTIMRNVLQRKYGGIFSAAFQDDVYQLFNAVCPNDRTEETKRKKRLQHHIRL